MVMDRAVRDMSRERERDYAQARMPAGTRDPRPGLALAPGRSLSWGVEVLPGAAFRAALLPMGESGWFELWVKAGDTRTRVLREHVPAGATRQVQVDLGAYAGQHVRLELACPEGGGTWIAPQLLTDASWLQPYPVPLSAVGEQWVADRTAFGEAHAGPLIELVGYVPVASPVKPGEMVEVDLYWHALQGVGTDYTVFVHLLNEAGDIVAQMDGQPVHGMHPTARWSPHAVVVDRHSARLRTDLPPGTYHVAVGLYDPTTSARLPATDITGVRLPDARLILAEPLVVEEGSRS
jgi:hypothetical protein